MSNAAQENELYYTTRNSGFNTTVLNRFCTCIGMPTTIVNYLKAIMQIYFMAEERLGCFDKHKE